VVIPYRRFWKNYQFYLQGIRNPRGGNSLSTFQDRLLVTSLRVKKFKKDLLTLEDETDWFSETSLPNCHYTQLNMIEECRSHPLRGWRLKHAKLEMIYFWILWRIF